MTRTPPSSRPDVRTFRLSAEVVVPLRQALAEVAGHTVEAITDEVPAYAEAFAGELGAKIGMAVHAALRTFLNLVSRTAGSGPGSPLAPALEAAYALGRGEARSGRSLDALLAAYRVGARVAWRDLASIAVGLGQDALTITRFAELVFAYIDELSAASVAGHADELATSGRVRRRHLERLTQALLDGEPPHVVTAAAQRADWPVPQTLTAVLLPERAARSVVDLLDPRTLQAAEDGADRAAAGVVATGPGAAGPGVAGPGAAGAGAAGVGVVGAGVAETSVLLVPDAHGSSRAHLMRVLAGRGAVVGPSRPWLRARESLSRATRTARLLPARAPGGAPVDTEDHLVALVVTADPSALADLRARALEPLAAERPSTAAKLAETLRSWLLHHGRREDVAADLFVHPQTVRYRMTRLRELYGDRLRDPAQVLLLTVALAVPGPPPAPPEPAAS